MSKLASKAARSQELNHFGSVSGTAAKIKMSEMKNTREPIYFQSTDIVDQVQSYLTLYHKRSLNNAREPIYFKSIDTVGQVQSYLTVKDDWKMLP